MASTLKKMALVSMVAAVASAAAVSAQELAPSPAPSIDTGAAFSLGMSGAVVCSSLFFSALALFRN